MIKYPKISVKYGWNTKKNIENLVKYPKISVDGYIFPNFISVFMDIGVDPSFRSIRFYSMARLAFYLFGENLIFFFLKKKGLGVATYFCFIFKGKNKIRKKTLKCDVWKKNRSMKNRVWVQRSGYLLGRYDKNRGIPLSP